MPNSIFCSQVEPIDITSMRGRISPKNGVVIQKRSTRLFWGDNSQKNTQKSQKVPFQTEEKSGNAL